MSKILVAIYTWVARILRKTYLEWKRLKILVKCFFKRSDLGKSEARNLAKDVLELLTK